MESGSYHQNSQEASYIASLDLIGAKRETKSWCKQSLLKPYGLTKSRAKTKDQNDRVCDVQTIRAVPYCVGVTQLRCDEGREVFTEQVGWHPLTE